MTVPSSLTSSQMTPIGGRPASLQRSTAASVWPERISTPPSRATSGKMWPGRTKSDAPTLPLARLRTVSVRSSAEMPVVVPCLKSTLTVKAVVCGGIVVGHHRREVEPPGLLARHRRADDAGGVAHDEGHLLRRAVDGGDDQVALVLAPVIVHDDDDLAALEGADGFDDFLLVVRHACDSRICFEVIAGDAADGDVDTLNL